MADQPKAAAGGAELTSVSNLNGLQKSALLLLGLGEAHAAAILKHMGPKEVQDLGMSMASLTNVTSHMMEEVMNEFVATIGDQTALGLGSDEYIRSMLRTQPDGFRVNSAVHLKTLVRPEHLAYRTDFIQHIRHEFLPAIARFDRHHQHQVNVRDNVL